LSLRKVSIMKIAARISDVFLPVEQQPEALQAVKNYAQSLPVRSLRERLIVEGILQDWSLSPALGALGWDTDFGTQGMISLAYASRFFWQMKSATRLLQTLAPFFQHAYIAISGDAGELCCWYKVEQQIRCKQEGVVIPLVMTQSIWLGSIHVPVQDLQQALWSLLEKEQDPKGTTIALLTGLETGQEEFPPSFEQRQIMQSFIDLYSRSSDREREIYHRLIMGLLIDYLEQEIPG
jgi:hypothetical protein